MSPVKTLECAQVVELLSDYVDGELDAERVGWVEAHLSTCDRCSSFGGEFAAVLKAVRRQLGGSADTAPETARRLDQALQKPGG